MAASRCAAVAVAGITSGPSTGRCWLTTYNASPMRRLSTKVPSMLTRSPAAGAPGLLTSMRCTFTLLRIHKGASAMHTSRHTSPPGAEVVCSLITASAVRSALKTMPSVWRLMAPSVGKSRVLSAMARVSGPRSWAVKARPKVPVSCCAISDCSVYRKRPSVWIRSASSTPSSCTSVLDWAASVAVLALVLGSGAAATAPTEPAMPTKATGATAVGTRPSKVALSAPFRRPWAFCVRKRACTKAVSSPGLEAAICCDRVPSTGASALPAPPPQPVRTSTSPESAAAVRSAVRGCTWARHDSMVDSLKGCSAVLDAASSCVGQYPTTIKPVKRAPA